MALSLWFNKNATPEPLGYDLPRAQIGDLNWTVDVNAQEPIELSFNFGNDGVYYGPSAVMHSFPALLAN